MRAALLMLAACGAPCPEYTEVARILEQSCNSCHGGDVRGANRQSAPREAVYDTEAQARAYSGSIGRRVDDGMPPASASVPRLTSDELATMRAWGQCQ